MAEDLVDGEKVMTKENIGIIGAGSWGIALAYLLTNNGHDVTVWTRRKEAADQFQKDHENKDKLPGVVLPDSVLFTSDLKEAVEGKSILVLVVPSAHMRETVRLVKPYISEDIDAQPIIVNCTKGIEESTLMLMSDVILDELPGTHVCVLSGPSHAEEAHQG